MTQPRPPGPPGPPPPPPDLVQVSGSGTAAGTPDVMVLDVSAESVSTHAASALSSAGGALSRMRDAALVAGVERKDVMSTATSLWTEHDHQGRPAGYRAVLGLVIKVRDLDRAGEILADVVAAGGDAARVRGTRFEHADTAELDRQARAAAFADALARAEQYAALAKRALGRVVAVVEGVAGGVVPVPRMAFAKGGNMALDAVPVEAGELAVTVGVTVTWELG